MNIPELYLVEPYNAYTTKKGQPRKKHWHEVIAEQEMMARLLAEAQRNSTLPNNAPHTATPQVATAVAAGAGGNPTPQFFNPSMTIDFTLSSTTASVPALISATNNGYSKLHALNVIDLNWNFGDGSTSFGPHPIHLFTTTGSNLVVTMSAVAKVDGTTITKNHPINLTAPTVVAGFTVAPGQLTGSSYTSSLTTSLVFTNTTTTNNPSNVINYLWNFGSGSNTASYNTSVVVNPSYTFNAAGTYTVLLSATGSFGITNAVTHKIQII